MHPAQYWEKIENGCAHCLLCPHGCVISEGRTGRCRVRGVREGRLVALAYGRVSSTAMDPIEKKPLYHFHPGARIFSVGGWGCNFSCLFCQNWSISQQVLEQDSPLTPADLVEKARRSGSMGIAYTYNEPLVGYEYVIDCARLARAAGLANVLVTNGFLCKEPAGELLPLVDAANIDIKSADAGFYREQCGGRLDPVLDFARQAVEMGSHIEITNLLVPGLNDDREQVQRLARLIARQLGPRTPLHLSRYYPNFRMTREATPAASLEEAHAVASENLAYVYLGNLRSATGQDTLCPQCGNLLVERRGYETVLRGIDGRACASCGRDVDLLLQ